MEWVDIVQAGSAVVVAGFTGALVLIANRQASIMKTQAVIQKSTLAATATAAEAATKSADAVEKSVNGLERPRVLIEKLTPQISKCLRGPFPSVEKPSVTLSLKNYGRSPALVSEIKLSLPRMTQQPGDPPFGVVPTILQDNNIIAIGQNETWTTTCFNEYPIAGEGDRVQIEDMTFCFWFFISVFYEDMLGKRHQTQMRFRYEPRDEKFVMVQRDKYTIIT